MVTTTNFHNCNKIHKNVYKYITPTSLFTNILWRRLATVPKRWQKKIFDLNQCRQYIYGKLRNIYIYVVYNWCIFRNWFYKWPKFINWLHNNWIKFINGFIIGQHSESWHVTPIHNRKAISITWTCRSVNSYWICW